MRRKHIEMYELMQTTHRKLIEALLEMEHDVKTSGDLEDAADSAYVLRECETLLQHAKTEVKRLSELTAKIFTSLWALDPAAVGEGVTTEWCTCKPNIKKFVTPPRQDRDAERFKAIAMAMGMNEEAIKSGLFRVDYDAFGTWLTERLVNGGDLPSCIDPNKTYTEYHLSIRMKKPLLTVQQALDDGSLEEAPAGVEENVDRTDETPF